MLGRPKKEEEMKRVLLSAVVFFFTVSSPALADIVYSGSQNVTLDLSIADSETTISIAGSGDAWDDFTVYFVPSMGMTVLDVLQGTPGGMGTGVPMLVGLGDNVSNLGFGTPIGPGSFPTALGAGPSRLTSGQDGTVLDGEFAADGGYIGLRMFGSSTYYGWLHMSSQSNIGFDSLHSVIFDGWAYENTGAPIDAGVIDAVPLPGALLLGSIGLGSAGWLCKRLRAWRVNRVTS
jgi:hypothetical protein